MIDSILKNPLFIGGSKNLDSNLIKISNGSIFCKGGAEGVFLFAHITKKIVGVIKTTDGNERALPSAVSKIMTKLNILSKDEKNKLSLWRRSPIYNHAKNLTGKIYTEIK